MERRGLEKALSGPETRTRRLKRAVQEAKPGICPERALIWTSYFKDPQNRRKPACIQIAEALCLVLEKKTIRIYPDELIVGNYTSHRVGGGIYPELHGLVAMRDLFLYSTRPTSPLQISEKDILRLLSIVPFWSTRFLGARARPYVSDTAALISRQLAGRFYIINETGGISHVAPDYEKLASAGAEGLMAEAEKNQAKTEPGSQPWNFYESVKIIADGLVRFGGRYATLAREMAATEPDDKRRQELMDIAAVCSRVPGKGAATFREALQSIFFAQVAINLESLDNSVCPGRMDFYLYPWFARDKEKGLLTSRQARELAAAFCIKTSEIVPVFPRLITRIHGGMFNGQVVTVGGTDKRGADSSNELSYIFLDIMDELRMRQPNFHARIHKGSPPEYLGKVYDVLARGANSPALYNDEVIVATMVKNGCRLADARNYTAVGCVEPVSQGKSFASTDAALFNVPLMLELAINEGRRFGSRRREGAATMPVAYMMGMDDVKAAFEKQLFHCMRMLFADLKAIEVANARFHPTPLTSMLLEGCLEKGRCSTQGGAVYNASGIQCVGPADTGDSLCAIERAVFVEKKFTLPELAGHLSRNLDDLFVRRYLKNLPKFGNDDPAADAWTLYVIDAFGRALDGNWNTRGGRYAMALYSVTAHEHYGRVTSALPNGRRKGEPFGAGISPSNGMDRKGPTALLNSENRIDFTQCGNGVNFNMSFDASTLSGIRGRAALAALMSTYFKRGGMQAQINVVDRKTLVEARDNPGSHPGLLVRVSGYSAYFADLTPAMQNEIIRRTANAIG